MSSYLHIDNKNKDITILGKASIQWLDNTTLKAEAEYSIDLSSLQRKFSLSFYYNFFIIVFYSLMPQGYINSKQKTLK